MKRFYVFYLLYVSLCVFILHSQKVLGEEEQCSQEPLPQDLSTYPYFQSTHELHLRSTYLVDYQKTLSTIAFEIKTAQSLFRMNIRPVAQLQDIILRLKQGGEVIDQSSSPLGLHISSELEIGHYEIEISYFGSESVPEQNCDVLELELTIVPKSKVTERFQQFTKCTEIENLPEIDFTALSTNSEQKFSFDSKLVADNFNIQSNHSTEIESKRIVKKYDFSLQDVVGANFMWRIDVSLGTDFILGGSLSLMIVPHQFLTQCLENSELREECPIGEWRLMNTHVLRATLLSGDYHLFIVENVGRKFSETDFPDHNGYTCTPFWLQFDSTPLVDEENFLSCREQLIPSDLGGPGFLVNGVFLHFKEDVFLDIQSTRSHDIHFSLNSKSIIRVYVEEHEVDIDLELRNETSVIASSARYHLKPDAILYELDPGSYTIRIKYFQYSGESYEFCETFSLEIAIDPIFDLKTLDCSTPTTPDLSSLQENLDILGSYHYPTTGWETFVHVYSDDYPTAQQMPVFTKNFTVNEYSLIDAKFGTYFLTGDLDVYLQGEGEVLKAIRRRDYIQLYSVLLPHHSYQLVVMTGMLQPSPEPLLDFPFCLEYTLQLAIHPTQGTGSPCEFSYVPLPTSFDGQPQFLAETNRLHIQDNFAIPRPQQGQDTVSSIRFSVQKPSFLRAYTEPHQIDIDFYLYNVNDTTTPLTTSQSNLEEEKITYVVTPGIDYELMTDFYFGEEPWSVCSHFNFEFALAPIESEGVPHPCATQKLPSADLVQTLVDQKRNASAISYLKDDFFFTQGTSALDHRLQFTLHDDTTALRVLALYEFVWGDLSLRILNEQNETLQFGRNGFDKNELFGRLSSGTYFLQIYETAAQTRLELQRCVSFTLELAVAVESPNLDLDTSRFQGCDGSKLPSTFSSISALSPLSNNQFHDLRHVLVAQEREDNVHFTIDEPTQVRVFLPLIRDLDVDLKIHAVGQPSVIIDQSTSVVEDELFHVFTDEELGEYVLNVKYYGTLVQEDCFTYPLELSFFPTRVLESPELRTCVQNGVKLESGQSLVVFNENVEHVYQREIGGGNYSFVHSFVFNLSSSAVVDFDVFSVFPNAGLWFQLTGTAMRDLDTPEEIVHSGFIGLDRAYLYSQALSKGSYAVTVKDVFAHKYPVMSDSICSDVFIGYHINTSAHHDLCIFDDLPRSLNDSSSRPFGGPQSSAGTIRFSGHSFEIPERGESAYISFFIPKASWFRIWVAAPENVDIDLYLYSDEQENQRVFWAGAYGRFESKMKLLSGQDEPYLLRLKTFSRPDSFGDVCPTFEIELAIETNATAVDEYICLNPLPNPILPESTIVFPRGKTVEVSSTTYSFTKEFIDLQANPLTTADSKVHFDITFDVRSNYSIFVTLGYDFLTTDFSLTLFDESGIPIVHGISGAPRYQDDWINFLSNLYYDIEAPGLYTLRITETIPPEVIHFDFSYCAKFQLAVLGSAIGDYPPAVEGVVPPNGNNLNPSLDLKVEIVLSETMNVNHFNTHWVFLLDESNARVEVKVYPDSVEFGDDGKSLSVSFAASELLFGHQYSLHIQSEEFVTLNDSEHFLAYTSAHSYFMLSCECNDHGYCLTNSTRPICVCDFPYTGLDCSECEIGYHPIADQCALDIACGNNSCNGHGVCHDERGYPECVCEEGFSSDAQHGYCSKCQTGYTGYPHCTSINEGGDELECDSTLLPTSFDTIAYLGLNGEFHLQSSKFFIDLKHRRHTITFTLKENSLFRIYIEPHHVDIDIWLYHVTQDGNKLIEKATSYNGEEAIYLELDGGSVGFEYEIHLNYFTWSTTGPVTDCETFNMEAMIAPVGHSVPEINEINQDCSHTSEKLPFRYDSIWTPDDAPFVVPESGYSYKPSEEFFLPIQHTSVDLLGFTVLNHKHLVELDSIISYRFLVSDLALQLVDGVGNITEVLAVGDNYYNVHSLKISLLPGNYTLRLYQPLPSNVTEVTCIPFEFSLHLHYLYSDEDVFNCAPTLPTTFNSPGFLDARGHLHIKDTFLLDENFETLFQINQSSLFRIDVHAQGTLRVFLFHSTEVDHVVVASAQGEETVEIFTQLESGHYKLQFYFSPWEFGVGEAFCATITVETALKPLVALTATCDAESDRFPTIDFNGILPYSVPSDDRMEDHDFFQFTPESSYTLEIQDPTYLEAILTSDFLVSNIKMTLARIDNEDSVALASTSRASYNRQILDEILEPATYRLTFRRRTLNEEITSCPKFNFGLHLVGVADIVEPCPMSDALPKTLNGMQYLGSNNEALVHSEQFLVPDFNGLRSISRAIDFDLTTESALRVYVEENLVDIDVHLYSGYNGTGTKLNHGDNGFSEESFIDVLEPGSYSILLVFWDWSNAEPCSTFNMELEIQPVPSSGRFLPASCPSETMQIWPQIPTRPTLPYYYNSHQDLNNTDEFYFQQAVGLRASHTYTFGIHTHFSIHCQISYAFLTGDLVLKLTDSNTGDTPYWGKNGISANILNEQNLPPGTYTLEIHEAAKINVPQSSIIGCSYFGFSLRIETTSHSQTAISYPPLPVHLNSIAYLKYVDDVHISGSFVLFASAQNMTSLTLQVRKPSLLRVNVDENVAIAVPTSTKRQSAGNDNLDPRSYVAQLDPDRTYTVDLTFTGTRISPRDVVVGTFEIAVDSSENIESALHDRVSITCVTDDLPPIVLDPQGTFQWGKQNMRLLPGDAVSGKAVHSASFTLLDDRVVYIRVNYQFLLGSFYFKLFKSDPNFGRLTREDVGFRSWNAYEVHEALTAGEYTLEVYLDHPNPSGAPYHAYCYDHDFVVLIMPENTPDCTHHDPLPWNLTDPGQTEIYGGPLRDGELTFFGDNFLFPLVSDDSTADLRFSITRPSLLSIFTSPHSSSSLDHSLLANGEFDSTTLITIADRTERKQHTSLYFLNITSSSQLVDLVLDFPSTHFSSCPFYALHFLLQPLDKVLDTLHTTCSTGTTLLPTNSWHLDGNVKSESFTSAFDQHTLGLHSSDTGEFTYEIEITVTRAPMELDVQLAFHSLANFFTLELFHKSEYSGNYLRVHRGSWAETEDPSSTLALTQQLSSALTPGEYKLAILQPRMQFLPPDDNYCFPFAYSLQLVPSQEPFVELVDPPEANDLSAEEPLYISVTLSQSPYTSDGEAVTREMHLETILSAFYLTSKTGENIHPESARGPILIGLDDYRVWRLTFAADEILENRNYTLRLRYGVLYNVDHDVMHLYTENVFGTRFACLYGNYDYEVHLCVCNDRYTGPRCDICEDGYELYHTLCVPENQCVAGACGCQSGISGCFPSGDCIPTLEGTPTCNCRPGFKGSRCQCEHCYSDNAHCNEETEECECNVGWTGANCDEQTNEPTPVPTLAPTKTPTVAPTHTPTFAPTTSAPSHSPALPTKQPPPPTSSPPTFEPTGSDLECPNSCSGNGDCNRATGVCICKEGFGGKDCSTTIKVPGSPSSGGSSWIVYVVIALGILVLIGAVIGVVYFVRRRQADPTRKGFSRFMSETDDEEELQDFETHQL